MSYAAAPDSGRATTRVVGLLRSASLIARVRDAIGVASSFDVEADLRGCLELLAAKSCEVLVVQMDPDEPWMDNTGIVRLRNDFPRLPILVYLSSRTSRANGQPRCVH